MNRSRLLLIVFLLALISCEEFTPKPRGFLRLDYPKAKYKKWRPLLCPFQFEKSEAAIVQSRTKNCWFDLNYPSMKATIYLTYNLVTNNYEQIAKEIEKLTYRHTIKATSISEQTFVNEEKKIFGTLYKVEGEVASHLQFFTTDSSRHILSGSLYFFVRPNPDSLRPAVQYIEKDIQRLIESLEWKEKNY